MRILIAEDDPVSRRVLESMLRKWEYEVVTCADGDGAMAALCRKDGPRLAILDWMMPSRNGPEVISQARRLPHGDYMYLMLLTAKGQREDIIQGLQSGADDYIAKPFDAEELRVRVRVGERIVQLQEQLLDAQEALRQQATHDALTGIFNRAEIMRLAEKEIDRAYREGRSSAVLMADVDHFKAINDTFGHKTGDVVLKEVATRLKLTLRSYDAIGRYGGEEFLTVLAGISREEALSKADELRRIISETDFRVGSKEFPVQISVGLAMTDGAVALDDLIHRADEALYAAKDAGRNCVVDWHAYKNGSRYRALS
ncbi:MAG: diguanylate cyclase [Phycisphaerae bacterium]